MPEHTEIEGAAHAGVTEAPVSVTASVSFGVVEKLVMVTLAVNNSPTVADGGHTGVAAPPTPPTAGVTFNSSVPNSASATGKLAAERLAPTVAIACSSAVLAGFHG
jgi:hypothetical protein